MLWRHVQNKLPLRERCERIVLGSKGGRVGVMRLYRISWGTRARREDFEAIVGIIYGADVGRA